MVVLFLELVLQVSESIGDAY